MCEQSKCWRACEISLSLGRFGQSQQISPSCTFQPLQFLNIPLKKSMEVVEGPFVDETSQMSVEMERASDMDSVAQHEDLQRTLHSSRFEKAFSNNYDRTLSLVKALLDAGHWDQVLPRYEKQVLLAATSTERTWRHFLEATVIPSASALASTGASPSQALFSTTSTKKSAAASSAKGQKPITRSKRGTTTPRRRGADVEYVEPLATDSNQESSIASREHVETLHTRLRTLIFDALVDEVLFPHEKHLEQIPLKESTKQGMFLNSFCSPLLCLCNYGIIRLIGTPLRLKIRLG
jgi:hypothetical protein